MSEVKVLVELDRSEVEALILELETPPNKVPMGPRTEALNTGWRKLRAALASTPQQPPEQPIGEERGQ